MITKFIKCDDGRLGGTVALNSQSASTDTSKRPIGMAFEPFIARGERAGVGFD